MPMATRRIEGRAGSLWASVEGCSRPATTVSVVVPVPNERETVGPLLVTGAVLGRGRVAETPVAHRARPVGRSSMRGRRPIVFGT